MGLLKLINWSIHIYLKIKERNEHIIDLYKNSNENTKECNNFIEVEDNDIVAPVTYTDRGNQI